MSDTTHQANTTSDAAKANARVESPQTGMEVAPLQAIGQHLTPRYIVQMQRVVGNRAMVQMIGRPMLQRAHDYAEMDNSDHGEDSLDLGLNASYIDWSELTSTALTRRSKETLYAVFKNLAEYHYAKEALHNRPPLSDSQLREAFVTWYNSGVKTRSQFKRLIGLGSKIAYSDDTNNIIQRARSGNSYSVNDNYVGNSNAHTYRNIIYYRDGGGNIDFGATPLTTVTGYNTTEKPTIDSTNIAWKDPVGAGSEVQMSTDLTDAESGLMPSGKKVKLKSATRSQHFAIADDIFPNTRSGTWTWHHLSDRYKMILVDMRVHAKHGHNGGVHLWK